MASRYESLVSASRPNDAHGIALQLVGSGKRVLELGAAAGHVTRELIARGNSVVAVEIDDALRDDLLSVTPEVVITDLDRLDLIEKVGFEKFDVVVAGDVLEHTINPRLVLQGIRKLIKTDGYLVISVPNIAHGDVRLALLNGEFKYRDVGILDRTHRTFFTRETLLEFLEISGFEDLEVFASTTPLGTTELRPSLANLSPDVLGIVNSDPLSSVYQFIVRAHPIADCDRITEELDVLNTQDSLILAAKLMEAGLVARDATIQSLTVENEQLAANLANEYDGITRAISELRSLVEQAQLADRRTSLELQDWSLGVLAELGEARAQLLHLEAALQRSESLRSETNAAISNELAATVNRLEKEMTRAYEAEKKLVQLREYEQQIVALHASTTWKIGRFFMLPIRVIRRVTRR